MLKTPVFSQFTIENDQESLCAHKDLVRQIISTYRGIIRLYAFIRFRVIPLRFLLEIEQYLPKEGEILDLGCGFGLFSLYMAANRPQARIIGLDISLPRLTIAQTSARQLGIKNVHFVHQDLREWRPNHSIAGAYALDLCHHIPVDTCNDLICALYNCLQPGGKFLLKDIDTHPWPMLLFTYLLDKLMSPQDHLCYRSAYAWRQQLIESGFSPVYLHYMWDILPYPHILLVCSKPI